MRAELERQLPAALMVALGFEARKADVPEPKRRGRKPIYTDAQRRQKAATYQRLYRSRAKKKAKKAAKASAAKESAAA